MPCPESQFEPIPEIIPAHHSQEKMSRTSTAIVAGTVAASLAVTCWSANRIMDSDEDDFCAPLTTEQVQAASDLLDEPGLYDLPVKGANRFERGDDQIRLLHAKEKELGIKLPVSDDNRNSDLEIALSQGNTIPYAEYEITAKALLDQVGIPFQLGMPDTEVAKGEKPTPEELETTQAKWQLLRLIKMFDRIPLNLTQNLGLTGVALTSHGEVTGGNTFRFGGLALTDRGVLILDMLGGDSTPPHELYHLIDAKRCGSQNMHNDPGFAALNKNASYANQWPLPPEFMATQPIPFSRIKDHYYTLTLKNISARNSGNTKLYCDSARELHDLTKDIETTDEYSHFNVAEDKANIGAEIFDPYAYEEMKDRQVPVRRAKFVYEFAGLLAQNSAVAKYYAFTASKSERPSLANC